MEKTPIVYCHFNKNFDTIKSLIKAHADPRDIKYFFENNPEKSLRDIDSFISKAQLIWNKSNGLTRIMKIKKLLILETSNS